MKTIDADTAEVLRALVEGTDIATLRVALRKGPRIPTSRVRRAIVALEAAGFIMPGPKISTGSRRPTAVRPKGAAVSAPALCERAECIECGRAMGLSHTSDGGRVVRAHLDDGVRCPGSGQKPKGDCRVYPTICPTPDRCHLEDPNAPCCAGEAAP